MSSFYADFLTPKTFKPKLQVQNSTVLFDFRTKKRAANQMLVKLTIFLPPSDPVFKQVFVTSGFKPMTKGCNLDQEFYVGKNLSLSRKIVFEFIYNAFLIVHNQTQD